MAWFLRPPHRLKPSASADYVLPVLFVCGSGRNRDTFLPYFTKIFNLRIDDDTMRRRLQERTDDDWPLGQEGVELMLELNRSDERPAGAIDIDATQPLNQVVDELLRLV